MAAAVAGWGGGVGRPRPTRAVRGAVWVALWAAVTVGSAASAAAVHEQWQPQKEGEAVDARLDRRGDVELPGRGVMAALSVLAEQFGVTLGVAPESATMVGERRVTVLVRDGSLRDIMVQIPRALQDCHWDVDRSGPELAYLLHGEAGMRLSNAPRPSREEGWGRAAEARRTYLDFAERALSLKEGELKGLEARSLYLACALRLPEERAKVEALFDLPAAAREALVTEGRVTLAYGEAPARLQQVAREIVQRQSEGSAEGQALLRDPSQATLVLRQVGTARCAQVVLSVMAADWAGPWGEFVLPGQEPQPGPPRVYYHDLLRAVGATGEAAAARAAEWQQAEERRRLEEELRGESGPIDPTLERPLRYTGDQTDLLSIQQAIAETGVPVVSDAFSLLDVAVPPMAREEMPAWRFAAAIAKAAEYECRSYGQYLVFRSIGWRGNAPREFPEPVVTALREKLDRNGMLSLEDLAAAAVALEGRPLMRGGMLIPKDLEELGSAFTPPWQLVLRFYGRLSPEQVKLARSAEGLPAEQMSPEQRTTLARLPVGRRVEEEHVAHQVFAVSEGAGVVHFVFRPTERDEEMSLALPRREGRDSSTQRH